MGQSPLALMMRPAPQHLPAVAGQFTDEELFWILREGVRFAAMPAWPAETNLGEIWAVVVFLRQLPGMSAEEFAALRAAGPEAPVTPWGEMGAPVAARFGHPSPPVDEYAHLAPTAGWTPVGLHGAGTPAQGWTPMPGTASAMTEADRADVAAYFTTRAPGAVVAPVPAVPSVAANATAQALVAGGDPARGLPACSACQGADTRAVFALAPRLEGRDEVDLKRRLDSFAEGCEIAAVSPMRDIPAALTAEERQALAGWYAGNRPGAGRLSELR